MTAHQHIKQAALDRLAAGESLRDVSLALNIHYPTLREWSIELRRSLHGVPVDLPFCAPCIGLRSTNGRYVIRDGNDLVIGSVSQRFPLAIQKAMAELIASALNSVLENRDASS